jgi:hypothetical protein
MARGGVIPASTDTEAYAPPKEWSREKIAIAPITAEKGGNKPIKTEKTSSNRPKTAQIPRLGIKVFMLL